MSVDISKNDDKTCSLGTLSHPFRHLQQTLCWNPYSGIKLVKHHFLEGQSRLEKISNSEVESSDSSKSR